MITNYELTQTGQEVQDILNQAPDTATDLGTEVTNRQNADTALQNEIDDIETAIGTDETANTIKGRIAELEDAVGTGGSVDERIAEVVGDAGEEYNTLGKLEDKIQEEASTRGIADSALQGSIDDINQIISDAVVKVSMSASSTPVAAGGTSHVSLTASANITFDSIVIEKGGSQIGSGTNVASLQITDTNVSTTGSTAYNATFTKQGMTKTASINVWAIYYGVGDTAANGQDFFVIKSGLGGTYSIVNDILQYIWFYIPSALSTSKPSATMGGFEFPLTADGDVTINGVSYKAYRSTARQYAGTYSIKLA